VTGQFLLAVGEEDTLDWRRRRDTGVYAAGGVWRFDWRWRFLPKVSVEVAPVFEHRGGQGKVRVKVTNPENAVAFMTHLRLIDRQGKRHCSWFWEDNYFTLLPKESREVWASYDANSLGEQVPVVLWRRVERQRRGETRQTAAAEQSCLTKFINFAANKSHAEV